MLCSLLHEFKVQLSDSPSDAAHEHFVEASSVGRADALADMGCGAGSAQLRKEEANAKENTNYYLNIVNTMLSSTYSCSDIMNRSKTNDEFKCLFQDIRVQGTGGASKCSHWEVQIEGCSALFDIVKQIVRGSGPLDMELLFTPRSCVDSLCVLLINTYKRYADEMHTAAPLDPAYGEHTPVPQLKNTLKSTDNGYYDTILCIGFNSLLLISKHNACRTMSALLKNRGLLDISWNIFLGSPATRSSDSQDSGHLEEQCYCCAMECCVYYPLRCKVGAMLLALSGGCSGWASLNMCYADRLKDLMEQTCAPILDETSSMNTSISEFTRMGSGCSDTSTSSAEHTACSYVATNKHTYVECLHTYSSQLYGTLHS